MVRKVNSALRERKPIFVIALFQHRWTFFVTFCNVSEFAPWTEKLSFQFRLKVLHTIWSSQFQIAWHSRTQDEVAISREISRRWIFDASKRLQTVWQLRIYETLNSVKNRKCNLQIAIRFFFVVYLFLSFFLSDEIWIVSDVFRASEKDEESLRHFNEKGETMKASLISYHIWF